MSDFHPAAKFRNRNLNARQFVAMVFRFSIASILVIGMLGFANLSSELLAMEVDPQEEKASTASKSSSTQSSSPDDDPLHEPVGQVPDWTKENSYTGELGIEYVIVKSEMRLKQREAEAELNELIEQVVQDRVDSRLKPGAAAAIGIDLEFIQENLMDGPLHTQLHAWRASDADEKLDSTKRDAFQCHAKLKLTPEFYRSLNGKWEKVLVRDRTMQAGLAIAAALTTLVLLFGYFTINHKTRGFYSGRLQTAAFIALIVLIVVVIGFARQLAWF